jgi:ubiquinone biosynthesis accessory factor UbiJ
VSTGSAPAGGVTESALAALEGLINRYLALDPEGAARLAELQGRVFLIELLGFGSRLWLIPGARGVQLYADYEAEPDCTITGSPAGLARLAFSSRREDQLFGGEVRLGGDTHLARELGEVLGGIDVDWEEQLSRLVGDPAAHQVGSGFRAAGRWGRQSADTLLLNLREYLQEEARIVPTRYEVDAFLGEVDTLRDDVERLEARIARLRKGPSGDAE